MKKKIVSLALTATMTLACMSPLLAGCSDTATDYDHTIIFYSSMGQSPAAKTQSAIERFEAKYPGWKVSHETQGGYDDVKNKIVSDLEGGNQPDLAYCYADHVAQYLSSEQVIVLDDYLTSTEKVKFDVPKLDADGKQVLDAEGNPETVETEYTIGFTEKELADFVPNYYEEGRAKNFSGYSSYGYTADTMLTIPFAKSTELLYYNKTVVDKLGLKDPNEEPYTWDYIWNVAAPEIKEFYPKATVLGYDSEANWFITMCEQNGWGYTSAEGNNYRFNDPNPELRSWLRTLNDYYENGWLATQQDYGSYTSALFTKGPEDGGCVFCVGSSGGASHQESDSFTAGVAPIPGTMKDGKLVSSAISQGPSLVMLKAGHGVSNQDEKAKMTFLFIKELLDPTFQAEFSIVQGYNPVRESVYDIKEYQDHMAKGGLTAQACKLGKSLAPTFFTSPAFVGSSIAREQVGNVLYYVMRGEKKVDDALADAYRNCGGK